MVSLGVYITAVDGKTKAFVGDTIKMKLMAKTALGDVGRISSIDIQNMLIRFENDMVCQPILGIADFKIIKRADSKSHKVITVQDMVSKVLEKNKVPWCYVELIVDNNTSFSADSEYLKILASSGDTRAKLEVKDYKVHMDTKRGVPCVTIYA